MKDPMTADLFHETLTLRTAYGDLVEHVCKRGADHNTVPLDDVLGGLNELGDARAAALLFAHRHGDTIEECQAIVRELRKRLAEGRRPRTIVDVLGKRDTPSALSWRKRAWLRWSRFWVADDEMSRRFDEAELRREGRLYEAELRREGRL